jgi:hypothetical protein
MTYISPYRSWFARLTMGAVLGVLIVICVHRSHGLAATPKADLDQAILSLRNMVPDSTNPDSLSSTEKDEKTKAINAAWETIKASGKEGVRRLKLEVRKTKPGQENYFKLNAARFLWKSGQWEEVQDILEIWKTADLGYHLHFPFHTAFEAAATKDPRALPLMKALLKDRKGIVQTAHMPLAPTGANRFIWRVYGPKGLPVLLEVLQTTKNPDEMCSAMHLLSDAQYLDALSVVRGLATHHDDLVRQNALLALGRYGHPDDFNVIVSGLNRDKPSVVVTRVGALALYDDLRAVPLLIPLLNSADTQVRKFTIQALITLLSPESLEALWRYAQTSPVTNESDYLKKLFNQFLNDINLSWDAYAGKPLDERKKLLRKIRMRQYTLESGEHPMSRDQLLEAARRWQQHHRLDSSIKARHLIAASTPADIDLLLEVEGAVLMRLSDECEHEAAQISQAIDHLGRSRYRKEPDITDKAELRR